MADQPALFVLEQKNSFLGGNDLTIRFDIIPTAPTDKALLVHVEDLDRVTNTVGGTKVPTSQTFDAAAQVVTFTIPVTLSDIKDMIYSLTGNITIDGVIYPYSVSETIEPLTVTVKNMSTDGIDMILDMRYTKGTKTEPVQVPGILSLNSHGYPKPGETLRKVEESIPGGLAVYRIGIELYQVKDPLLFAEGVVTFNYPKYSRVIPFSKQQHPSDAWNQFPNPLTDYAMKNMWGHRELDHQHQLKLGKISPAQGNINNFFYIGRSFLLPDGGRFYHVFSMGGLDINFWNMGQRNHDWWPMNTWKLLSEVSNERGVALDIYNAKGHLFPRGNSYLLNTYEGVTFIALPVTKQYPIPLDKSMYVRCYTCDINTVTLTAAQQGKSRFGYYFVEHSSAQDWLNVKTSYNSFAAYGTGRVALLVNGIVTDINKHVPVPGQLLEVYYDPTVGKTINYRYSSLADFNSTMDSKRKLILFPGDLERTRRYKFFDDCDFYVVNRRTGQGIYYHRNSADAIRQLTHQDYALTGLYVEFLVNQLIALDLTHKSTEKDMDILVCYRDTKWEFKLGPTSSRINDLYLLEDPEKILQAMTGAQSTILEWSAPELEKSPVNAVLNASFQELTTELVREGLGYNGCSEVLSAAPLYMPFIFPGDPGHEPLFPTPVFDAGLGYRIPASFVESSTAYEYDKDGLYIRNKGVLNNEWYKPGAGCYFVEFVVGRASTWLDYEVSRSDVEIRKGYGFRVYKAGWLIDPTIPDPTPPSLFANEFELVKTGVNIYPSPYEVKLYGVGEGTQPDQPIGLGGGKPDGNWVDITDSTEYKLVDGHVVWNFDVTNHVGMVVFDTVHLYNTLTLNHIDKSLYFHIMHTWSIGGIPLVIQPGQLDIWLNKHLLIENVDYVIDYPRVFITSKMWLNANDVNEVAYRGRGLSANGLIPSSELGFVYDGVIGYNGRYNLRIDRPTRAVINGRLYLTEGLDWAEDINHGNNVAALNGFPYEVKHIYADNKYVEYHDLHWGFEKARDLDYRIGSYLTENVTYKPDIPLTYPYLEVDRYRVFSPFISQLVNEMVNGFLDVPTPDDSTVGYSDQLIDDLTREYQWLLKYDPVLSELDVRYFSYHPYSNMSRPTITANQLTVISRANDLYLGGKLKLDAFFEVIHNVGSV